MIKAKKVKNAEAGTVIVLTLAGLVVILGVIGLAIDFGLMFDYKQRAQNAADAAALAAAINPTDYLSAAREIAEKNGFKHGVGTTIVNTVTPPGTGDFTATENTNKYFEVTVNEDLPTTFLKMIGKGTLPIVARAVARIGGTGNCMTVGAATTENNLKLNAPECQLYFLSLNNKGEILANQININKTNPPPPGTFPATSQFNCPTSPVSKCDKGDIVTAGCYLKIEVKGECTFGPGAYYINSKLQFDTSADATGSGVTFFLASGSSLDFNGKATLTSGAVPDFVDVLFWSNGNQIEFGPNSKADLTGLIYAPDVTSSFAGKIELKVPSNGNGSVSGKGLLVE